VERRGFLSALAGASVLLKGSASQFARAQALPGAPEQTSKPGEFPPDSTIILVHGAWADGSCWRNVILPLEKHGLKVICAPIPLTSLTDDAAALKRALEQTTGPAVLVGHAYSGAVIAAVPEDRVKSLVYITALAPDEGETVAKVFYRDAASPERPMLTPDSHGFIWMSADGVRRALAQNASADEKSIAAAVQRPIAVRAIQEPAPKPTWKTKPSWFLIAEEDRMINPKTQRFMADRMGATVQSRRVDHTPMYTEPHLVAGIILEAARKTLAH
jgi:pimeloyl-ACP methyl ester carboxylesterase